MWLRVWANVPQQADLRTCPAAGEPDGIGDMGLPWPVRSHGCYADA
jgi:hypothetical protein